MPGFKWCSPKRRRFHALAAAAVLTAAVGGAGPSSAAPPDVRDACARTLRRTVNPQTDGSHLPLLFSLRQMRDRRLEPVFTRMAREGDWQMQVHAVLALAETSPDHRLDPALVRSIEGPAQEAVIASAIDLDLLPVELIKELLKPPEIEIHACFLLQAELAAHGEKADMGDLARIAAHDDVRMAGLASCILAEQGDPRALETFRNRWFGLSDTQRETYASFLQEGVRQYKLKQALPFVQAIMEDTAMSAETVYRGLFTLLDLDPEGTMPRVREWLGSEPDYVRRVRAGMLLLAAYDKVEPAAFEMIGTEDELLSAMTAVGMALAGKRDSSTAMMRLLDQAHPRSSEWAMNVLDELPPEQSAPVYLHLIDQVEPPAGSPKPARSEGDRVAMGVTASTRLFKAQPDQFEERFKAAPNRGTTQQAMLLGLIEANDGRAADIAALVPRTTPDRSECLACLVIARNRATISGQDINLLGKIASGGGRVSDVLQVQAAWLYLQHTGQAEEVLAGLFASQ